MNEETKQQAIQAAALVVAVLIVCSMIVGVVGSGHERDVEYIKAGFVKVPASNPVPEHWEKVKGKE